MEQTLKMKILILFILIFTTLVKAQTQIIAHRGFWKTNPETTENSLKALGNAMDLQVYGSEFDVRMSKDGKLVINHDEHHGKMEISETNYADLKKLKLSNGEKIPTLKKYLKLGRKFEDMMMIVELKPAKTKALEDEIVKKTIQLIEKLRMENQCEFISFSLNICKELKRLKPFAKVQYLNGDLSPMELKNLNIDGFDYHYKILTEKHPTWIDEAKKLGLITNSWTVNDPKIFKKLQKMGIGFVTTNVPNEFQKIK